MLNLELAPYAALLVVGLKDTLLVISELVPPQFGLHLLILLWLNYFAGHPLVQYCQLDILC